jgi:uncharacterized protein YbbK (DUF523 family)
LNVEGAAVVTSVLVSACLLGHKVRYDGGDKACDSAILASWLRQGRVLAICPEVAGGFPTPRPPAEIEAAQDGVQVLRGAARVMEDTGRDVTLQFVAGAQAALRLAQAHGVRVAVLKEGSPSCGSGLVYDGSFSGRTVAGAGVTAALLRQNGVFVFSELQIKQAQAQLEILDDAPAP